MIARLQEKVSLVTPGTHKKYITTQLKKDIATFRPDILHRCLLTIQDSPLNKAGLLKVLVHTMDNVLIEFDPSCRVELNNQIPRTEEKFYQLMAQVLEKLRIRAVNSSKTLIKVVKNPVTDHLPTDCLKVDFDYLDRCFGQRKTRQTERICTEDCQDTRPCRYGSWCSS